MGVDRTPYIVSCVRTPVGRATRGVFQTTRPEVLGAIALREAVHRVPQLSPADVDDVLVGCAFPEGPQGMNLGRIIVQRARFPDEIPGGTVNRFCASGLQTIAMASQAVAAGFADVVVAGGAESMSMVPMTGFFFQPDPEIADRDSDVYVSMGITAENVASRYGVSREDQDAFALRSHQRAVHAIDEGLFDEEVVPVDTQNVVYDGCELRTQARTVARDEGPRRDTSLEALASLPPVFMRDGTVTAGNSSQRSDGAAMAVIMSGRKVREAGIEPRARLLGFALAGVAPDVMGIGPVEAIQRVLRQTGLSLAVVGLIELNEAFAAQALAVMREIDLDEDVVNVSGGAIALGHPLGCTGAKLTTTLLHAMERRGVQYGICSMCVGGGMGAAGLFENLRI